MSFYQLDQSLTRYYLSREINGDTVVRFIDASAKNIAAALGREEEHARETLLSICRCNAKKVYQSGYTQQTQTHEATGCLPYLVLACHAASSVSSLPEKDKSRRSRNFRDCVVELLQDKTIQDFSGLNTLWKILDKWTNQNSKDFIPVELATSCDHRTIIGLTQDMSFPAWRDEAKIQKALSIHGDMDETILERNLVHYTPADAFLTQGCTTLLDEYKELMRHGSAERRATRFWDWLLSLVNQQRLGVNEENSNSASNNYLILESTPEGWVLGSDESLLPLEFALQQAADFMRYDVEKYLDFGLVFFEETGLGRYVATLHPEECRRGALLYDSVRHDISVPKSSYSVLTLQIGSWVLILDLASATFETILDALRNNDDFAILRGCVFFMLHGGVKHYSRILAIPKLAPRIHCLRDGAIHFIHDNRLFDRLSCRAGEMLCIPEMVLRKGCITVRYVGVLGKERICASRNLYVCECSPPFKRAQGSRSFEIEVSEADQGPQAVNPPPPSLQLGAETMESSPIEEALYLAGGSGWHTTEIRELCDTLHPDISELSWLTLRSLMEGGWLTPVWGKSWGYKLHRLTPASLIAHPAGVLLWGARPQWLCEDFTRVAQDMGASIRRTRFGPLAPVSLLAEGADIAAMAERLQLCAQNIYTPHLLRPLPASTPDWMQADARYMERKVWNWETCRLHSRNDTPIKQGVSLVQLHVPDAPRHQTLYQVRKKGKELLTTPVYTAAVLYAHQLARQPLFRLIESGIVPLHASAFLPLPLVHELAQWNILCPGPILYDGAWRYAYPFTKAQQSFVVAQLGEALFVGHTAPPTMPVIYRHKSYGRFLYTR